MTAVYIHIPFCEHICYYCDFNKVFLEGQPVDQYIDTLLLEMKMRLEERPVENVETIFVGGEHPQRLHQNNLINFVVVFASYYLMMKLQVNFHLKLILVICRLIS